MSFSLLSITEAGNSKLDSWISIIGQIIIPVVIFFIVNIYFEAEKQRKSQIRALNYLTLHFHQMLQECLKLTNNEQRRKACLEKFINEPTAENYKNAFYLVRTPSLSFKIFAGDYTFTTSNYPQLINLIFEIDSVMENVLSYVHESNRQGDIAANLPSDKQVEYAQRMYYSLDDFHKKLNILIYLIDKILLSIKVYNSSFFHQKLVVIQFAGVVKELVDKAIKELDEVNKFRNPNWRDSFIDSPDNPPIKLTFKDIIYVGYLKTMCWFDTKINNIRKYHYNHENKKFLEEQIISHSFYSEEQIKQLNDKYQEELNNFKKNKDRFDSLDLKKSENYFLYKGYIRRLEQIVLAAKEIFSMFPPERDRLLLADEIYKAKINLDYIVVNFVPAMNNLFQFMVKHFNPNEDIDDISFLSEKLKNYVAPGYFEHLQKLTETDFYKFHEGFDESISYGLPFELATCETNEQGERMPGVQILQYRGTNQYWHTIHEYILSALGNLNKIATDIYEMIISSPELVIMDKRVLDAIKQGSSSENNKGVEYGKI